MRSVRVILVAAIILIIGGATAWTASYGLRMRSTAYRESVEADLNAFFELPCRVGAIRGHTFNSRLFEDVRIWLPDRRDLLFTCKEAIWKEESEGADQPFRSLWLNDGLLMLGSDRWQHEDYRQVLQSGLGHDFADLHLSHVELNDFEIGFDRGTVSIRCRETSGKIDMSDPKHGVAHLVAYELNGRRVGQGVRIDADFIPDNGVDVTEFNLVLPEIPLATIGIEQALGGSVTQGMFAGSVRYIGKGDVPELQISGRLRDAELAELTKRVPFGPLDAGLTVDVEEARISRALITHFRGKGLIENLKLAPLASLLGLSRLSGEASLRFDNVSIALGHIEQLRMDGRVQGLILEEWLRLFGRGTASGRLSLRIANLHVVDDAIHSADIEITAVPPSDGPGYIERKLLVSAAERLLEFEWPESVPQNLLPKRVEYSQFGVRLIIRDNILKILGTHGKGDDTILTILVWGTPIPLLKEPDATIDLGPLLQDVAERVRSQDPARVRDWWRSHEMRGLFDQSDKPAE